MRTASFLAVATTTAFFFAPRPPRAASSCPWARLTN
ncbi:hypothetical protein BH23VER1_BH23VER1_10370 [soil metagenome]